MRWSKLKQMIEARLAPAMRGRIAIQMTRYHKAHDDEGELWLTLDGQKIYGSSYYQYLRAAFDAKEAGYIPPNEIDVHLHSAGIAPDHLLAKALFACLNQSIEDMLTNPHPMLRALAILDERCGTRRLARLDVTDEHELVRTAYGLRTSKSAPVP